MTKRNNHIVSDAQTVTVSLGASRTIEVDLSRFTDAAYEHVFNYGLRQILNDAHASEKDGEAKLALSAKRLEKLYAGEFGRAAPAPKDPIGREAARLAKQAWKAWPEAKRNEVLARMDEEAALAKIAESFRPKAEAMLKAMAEASSIDI